MIFEIYIIDFNSGIPYIDKTYRKIHLGVSNNLVSGLLHVSYTMFNSEMEIGHIKSLSTKEYKLIYLMHNRLLFIALADIKLDENKIDRMLHTIAHSFYDENKDILGKWNNDLTVFQPFIPKMDTIVIGTIADLFFENYPSNIVSLTEYIHDNYTQKNQEQIGKSLAETILEERYANNPKKSNLKKELSKFSVVKNMTDEFVELSVCPFCRKKESQTPICNFVTGFINGMLKSTEWTETTCVGCGDAFCSYSKV